MVKVLKPWMVKGVRNVHANTMKATTKILRNGRITVPYTVRETLELEHGDVVEVEVKPVEGDDG